MGEKKQRYAIHMKNGMVVACTSETLPSESSHGNIHFKEIDLSVALAIRDGRITKEEVIRQIQSKTGVPSYSEMMEGMKHLNVRERDIGLEAAIKEEIDTGDSEPVKIDIPGAKETKKTAKSSEKKADEKKADKEESAAVPNEAEAPATPQNTVSL